MSKAIPAILFVILIALFSCKKESKDTPPVSRSYMMGFQSSAPRPVLEEALRSLHLWELRADAAIISTEVPWNELLSGMSAVDYVAQNYKGLVDYYRTRNFKLWVYIDPANGLDRAADAVALKAVHKSIAQSTQQAIYHRFVFVMDSMLKPEHLGLALETNLIRGVAPDSIYQGVRKAATDAATEVRAYDKAVKLSVSVQVDYAWGKLDNSDYKSVDKDFLDFPFIEELGLSSYPYFAFNDPKDIPLNYYSRLIEQRKVPVFVSEGGWSTASSISIACSAEKQRAYMFRHDQLLAQVKSIALFQLTFTDFDMSGWPASTPTNFSLFTSIGLVDTAFTPKPALQAWDSLFQRKLSVN